MYMHNFLWVFKGDSSDGINWGIEMKISGSDPVTVGRMLAEYAASEFAKGHPQALAMVAAAKENLARIIPGVWEEVEKIQAKPKIISLNDKKN